MLKGYWLVADMDGTITPTPTKGGGHYLPLDKSPCQQPLVTWLESGGGLCVVSTGGNRMWNQIHKVLKPTLLKPGVGTLLLCGFGGAALFESSPKDGELYENVEYRTSGACEPPTSTSATVSTVPTIHHGTVLPPDSLHDIEAFGAGIIYKFFDAAKTDAALIPLLSDKYQVPYQELLKQLQNECGGDIEVFKKKVIPLDALTTPGKFLAATNDRLVDMQTVPGAFNGLDPIVANMNILGIPIARFDQFFTKEVLTEMDNLGLYCKKQPNSVYVARKGIGKATAVKWLIKHKAEYNFDLKRSIALGDNPATVDKDLTKFPPMPFVSLALNKAEDPPGSLHVGYEEDGTAVFLASLLEKLMDSNAGTASQLIFETVPQSSVPGKVGDYGLPPFSLSFLEKLAQSSNEQLVAKASPSPSASISMKPVHSEQ